MEVPPVCERCGSHRVHEFERGDYECQECGYIVYSEDYEDEDESCTE